MNASIRRPQRWEPSSLSIPLNRRTLCGGDACNMKHGFLFSAAAVVLTTFAMGRGGWFYILLWPAFSVMLVAFGYFHFGPRVFGKSKNGLLSPTRQLLLLPYLMLQSAVWHANRLITKEPAFDQLIAGIVIGRRLLSHERPVGIDHVIDLTCEFTEPRAMRSKSYHSFAVLDACAPSVDQLQTWITCVATLPGTVYIHCAQGHGRTGVFAAALLLHIGHSRTPTAAVQFIRSKRPRVHLNRHQFAVLEAVFSDP